MDEKLYSTQTNYDDRCLEVLSQPREGIICTVGPNSTPQAIFRNLATRSKNLRNALFQLNTEHQADGKADNVDR